MFQESLRGHVGEYVGMIARDLYRILETTPFRYESLHTTTGGTRRARASRDERRGRRDAGPLVRIPNAPGSLRSVSTHAL